MFSSLQSALVTIYPYAIFIVGLLMGWRFSRSRLIFIILVLTLADRLVLRLNLQQSENPQTFQMVWFSISWHSSFLSISWSLP
jgi:hypothetical protein